MGLSNSWGFSESSRLHSKGKQAPGSGTGRGWAQGPVPRQIRVTGKLWFHFFSSCLIWRYLLKPYLHFFISKMGRINRTVPGPGSAPCIGILSSLGILLTSWCLLWGPATNDPSLNFPCGCYCRFWKGWVFQTGGMGSQSSVQAVGGWCGKSCQAKK